MSAGHPASRARGGVPSGGDDLDNLTRFEREWFAHLTRGELDQAAQALPEDYTFISSDGVLMGKTEGLDRLRETKFKNIRVENVSARRYGGVAVLVTRFQVRTERAQGGTPLAHPTVRRREKRR